jgi:hypothetical protein
VTPATATKLTADQARRLHAADVDVARLKAQLEEAEKHQKDLRGKYRDRVPLSDDLEERAKGIRACVVGGVTVRIFPMVSAERFSLSAYKAAGHGITPEMREHLSDGKPYDRWTVKDSRGPAHLDRVEPKQ